LSDRGHVPYPAADLEERAALLTVRDQPDGPATTIPRERWRFARSEGGRAVPDAGHIHLDGGFEKGRLYQVAYTAEGAPVQGLSMAALREAVAWLKHGGAAGGNPAPGRLRWAYAYGRSQTGRLLRTMIYEDLNLDEQGREALDGVLANVAGGMRGEFNQRFGQHSKDRNNMMAHLFPFTDQPAADPDTGAKDALHARLDARGSRLRVYYTNTSAEYHRGDASLIHTDPDGQRDAGLGPYTRVYHFAGTEHGLGIWPPTDTQTAPADPTGPVERSQNLRGVVDYSPLLRACLVHLDRWVVEGIEPPPSRHPRVADGTAVPPDRLAAAFGRIPGARYPRHNPRPRRLDWSALPPTPGRAFGSLVSAVDADGNEVGGIVLPELAVPLAAHTGWNLRHPDIGGAEQLLVFAGATIPLARTRAEREASGDPRPSIAERYASREAYLDRVREAARALAREGYLLEDDVALGVDFGVGRSEQHFRQQLEDLVGVLVEEAGVEVGRLLAGRRVDHGAEAVEALGNLDRRVALGSLEQEMLEEMRDPRLGDGLVARAGPDPEPERNRAHRGNLLGHNPDARSETRCLCLVHRHNDRASLSARNQIWLTGARSALNDAARAHARAGGRAARGRRRCADRRHRRCRPPPVPRRSCRRSKGRRRGGGRSGLARGRPRPR